MSGLATAWRVALLIDKVGVFLVVALFLRNVAYQVTRRSVHEDAPDPETFDKALSPHIYVEPYFDELSLSTKVGKAGVELEHGGLFLKLAELDTYEEDRQDRDGIGDALRGELI